jgi:uncharacterized membrane protein YfhO
MHFNVNRKKFGQQKEKLRAKFTGVSLNFLFIFYFAFVVVVVCVCYFAEPFISAC